ncbi:MAG: hypothetical protein NTW06_01835 [Candidatus Falkowbacteria bacterium]|nr:hypothetical protein [Candidatus Falkowbacteria bacterium]
MFENLENKGQAGDAVAPKSQTSINNPGAFLPGNMPSEKLAINAGDAVRAALPNPATTKFEEKLQGLYDKGKRRGKRYSIIGIVGSLVIVIAVAIAGYYLLSQIKDLSQKVDQREQDTVNLNTASEAKKEEATTTTAEKKIEILPEWRICTTDEDCIETQTSCCECQNGGEQGAINKNYSATWQSAIETNCQPSTCVASSTCKTGKASCTGGVCFFDQTACAKEGEVIGSVGMPASCCEGLKPLGPGGYNGDCSIPAPPGGLAHCARCGDKICGNGENKCTCPEDCALAISTEVIASSSTNADIDSDNDGLTDSEETKYGTDPQNSDTDGDGYKDGDEVKNGYNPLGSGKLIIPNK